MTDEQTAEEIKAEQEAGTLKHPPREKTALDAGDRAAGIETYERGVEVEEPEETPAKKTVKKKD